MRIAPKLLDQIVAHAQREAPNECCGLVAVRDGVAVAVHALANAEASPFRFSIDSREQLAAYNAIEDSGAEVGAIYHSHTRSAPEPSQTDVNFAAGWPGVEWLIVGLKGDAPEVRNWRIDDGEVAEAPLELA